MEVGQVLSQAQRLLIVPKQRCGVKAGTGGNLKTLVIYRP